MDHTLKRKFLFFANTNGLLLKSALQNSILSINP